ncbi:MAG TPA: DUF4375 domain-containing protein [Pirellulales bacterium]|nr:DUF4375 domain-containing protein [Pirellulales bacterium]
MPRSAIGFDEVPMTDDHMEKLLDRASERAFAAYEENGRKMAALPRPLQIVVIIYSAQGIIDNGGLQYFYESDWPEQPPYSVFIEAYRAIGALNVANCIEQTAAMFPFPEPHLHQPRRDQFLTELDQGHEFHKYSDNSVGDESVLDNLAEYVSAHLDEFKDATGGGN